MKSSSIKTQERKKKIKGEHEVEIEIKRGSMMQRQTSKQSFMANQELERRALSTIKREEITERIMTTVSKGGLIE
jgi:hypothetical protein